MENKQSLVQKIYIKHKSILKNLNYQNKKVLVVFNGTFGSGKTTVAKKIELKFKGIRINNDDIRNIIDSLVIDVKENEKQEILIEYLKKLFEFISKGPNGLIILDSSIDRKYEIMSKLAQQYKYELFIISMDLSKETIIERIQNRGQYIKTYIDRLEQNYKEFKKRKETIKPDYIINEKNCSNYKNLYITLSKKL